MDQEAMWDIVLTDEEIARIAAGEHPTKIQPEHLTAYWPLLDEQKKEDHDG